MFGLPRIAAAAFVTVASIAGLLVVAAPVAALREGGASHTEVSVLADSPWDLPKR